MTRASSPERDAQSIPFVKISCEIKMEKKVKYVSNVMNKDLITSLKLMDI